MVCGAHGNEISAAIVGGVFTDPLTTTSFWTILYIERKGFIDCLQLIQISEVPLQKIIIFNFIFLLFLKFTVRVYKIHFRNAKSG
jgi:hypothetical protein